ncbi:hypothetical protein PRUPE_6G098300 [Prunus persica]|uniref:Uncharacterized protein n=1 Tax=Prunus persica TaxID=3760 RepID=M5W5X7_PRUPE|nr:hypothetical protein PRUPE_6G098300 [Prunus persica]
MANSRNVSLAFHFHPTDQEIIRSILYKMVIEREPLNPSYHGIVHDEDLFGTKEPWKIWEDYGRDQLHDQDLYFICQLKRINYCSSRTHRRIGCEGTWSQRVAPKLIYDGNPNPIGNVRKLRYKNPKSEHNAEWFLDEYSLFVGDEGHDQTTPGFDFVVCRLRKNHNKINGYFLLAARSHNGNQGLTIMLIHRDSPESPTPLPTQPHTSTNNSKTQFSSYPKLACRPSTSNPKLILLSIMFNNRILC